MYAEDKKIKEKINCKIAFIFNTKGKSELSYSKP